MTSTLEQGQWIAVALHDRGLCPAGRVRAVDTHGVRLAPFNWQTGDMEGLDIMVPWAGIAHLIAAPAEYESPRFLEAARAFRERYGPDESEGSEGSPRSLDAPDEPNPSGDASSETGPPLLETIPPEFYELHVRELNLSPNIYKWLVRGNLSQIGWLAECSESDLLRYPKIGRKHVAEIREKLLAFTAKARSST